MRQPRSSHSTSAWRRETVGLSTKTWTVRKDFSASVRVVDTSFSSERYAIVLPKGSSLRPMLDLAVLDHVESDWWQQTLFQTLGNARSP